MDLTFLDGFEKQLQGWYKGAPNLPKNFSAWLAKYSWVFVLIGAVLMTFAAIAMLSVLGILTTATYAYGATASYGFFGWIALLSMVIYLFLSFKAVSPLKAMKKEGWKLLYYLEVFYLVFGLLQWLTQPAFVGNLLGSLIGAALGFYFLFQVKEYFK